MRVLAGREPAHVRHRLRIVGLAAELLDLRRAGFDVVDREVGARSLLAELHVRDRGAALVADPRHEVIVRPDDWVRLALPPEKNDHEFAYLIYVLRLYY